jgi:hypothetical protein
VRICQECADAVTAAVVEDVLLTIFSGTAAAAAAAAAGVRCRCPQNIRGSPFRIAESTDAPPRSIRDTAIPATEITVIPNMITAIPFTPITAVPVIQSTAIPIIKITAISVSAFSRDRGSREKEREERLSFS